MRGTHDVLRSVVGDLRAHDPLVSLLPERQAIYDGEVTGNRDYPAEVTVTPVSNPSTPHRGIVEREYRIQVTVKTTRNWREERDPNPGGLYSMYEILSRVSDRLDRAPGIPETARGGEGGPDPMHVEDGRLAVMGDWRVVGHYFESEESD